MAVKTLNLSELARLPEAEQDAAIAAFGRAPAFPLNGEVSALTARIMEYEARYEMSSETMRKKVERGEQCETAEVGCWLMLLELRARLEQQLAG